MLNKIEKGMSNAAEKINENFEEFNDYVIEQGENYTKWASGKLECWGIYNTGNLDLTEAVSAGFPGYYTPKILISLPVPFVGVAYPFANLKGSAYRSPLISVIDLEEPTILRVTISQYPSSWSAVNIYYYIIGRWQ
jgi:hypothetical protein